MVLSKLRIPAALTLVTGVWLFSLLLVLGLATVMLFVVPGLSGSGVPCHADRVAAGGMSCYPMQIALHRLLIGVVLIVAVSAVSAVGLRCWLNRKIIHPLDGAMKAVSAVAKGDLSRTVVVTELTQAKRLFTSIREMQAALIQTILRVQDAVSSIEDTIGQMRGENAHLAARTEQQAAAVEQTTATIQQLTATVTTNAELAKQTHRFVEETSQLIAEGAARVEDIVKAMGAMITDSGAIAAMADQIDEIAAQTNILALNAAVEAARAGPDGRGFAVVAAEVRNLAQKSAGAASEIAAIVGRSKTTIEQGARVAGDVAKTMLRIVAAARQASGQSAEMSASAADQRVTVEEIGAAIEQIDHVTQSNAALVEESVRMADGLNQRARELVSTVSVWKVR
ncbi:methyl-accepting chemotaxis protein [Burkholderia sp. PvR073]|uniref:methyl-accepting chemotaxis protein n=1 Tax=Burkholderia TaxID=32008 RepID=UPI00254F3929|nr:methyl-accepting chemotaxis protein [Burkholderia sp. lyk4-R2A-23]